MTDKKRGSVGAWSTDSPDQDRVLQDLVLEKLLKNSGKEMPQHLQRLLKLAQLRLDGEQFAVLVVRVIELGPDSSFQSPGPYEKYLEDFDRIGGMVDEAAERYFHSFGKVYSVNMGDGIPCLLELSPHPNQTDEEIRSGIHRQAEQMVAEILDTYKVELSISISRFCHQITELSERFREAYELSLYNLFTGRTDRLVDDCQTHGRRATFQVGDSVRDDHLFYEAVGQRSFAAAEDALGDMACAVLVQNLDGYMLLPMLLSQSIRTALELYSPPLPMEKKLEIMDEIEDLIEGYLRGQPDGFGTVDNVLEMVSQLVGCIQQNLTDAQGLPLNALSQAAIYIKENFTDQNLNISLVAEKFGFRASQFTRAFKQLIGVNPLDYLHFYRVSEAKKLLLDTELTVAEIARRTGYFSSRALIQSFKRYEGITPGKYRETLALSKEGVENG